MLTWCQQMYLEVCSAGAQKLKMIANSYTVRTTDLAIAQRGDLGGLKMITRLHC